MARVSKVAKASSPTKKTKSIRKKLPHLYRERHPELHKITGKFTMLYVLLALSTLIFAGISVYLFCFASNIMKKYESIDAKCRSNHCELYTTPIYAPTVDATEK